MSKIVGLWFQLTGNLHQSESKPSQSTFELELALNFFTFIFGILFMNILDMIKESTRPRERVFTIITFIIFFAFMNSLDMNFEKTQRAKSFLTFIAFINCFMRRLFIFLRFSRLFMFFFLGNLIVNFFRFFIGTSFSRILG